jgi:hypothetical protein
MGVRVSWDNPDRDIIRFEFDGEWNWDELHAASDQATDMLDTSVKTVDFIMDIRSTNKIPGDVMSHAERLASGSHARRGLMVVVGANKLLRTLSGGLRKLFPVATQNVILAADMEEAYMKIYERQV